MNRDRGRKEFDNPNDTPSEYNFFVPASLSAGQQFQKTGEFSTLDYFEGKTTEDLQQVFEQRSKRNKYLSGGVFAILDERSSKDRTLIVYYLHSEFDDMEERIGQTWVSWRVRFEESFILVSLLQTKGEFYDNVFCLRDRFVDENGIFPVNAAMEQIENELVEENRLERLGKESASQVNQST